MAYANDIRSQSGFSVRERLSAFVQGATEARAKRAVYNRTLRELEALSERDLNDLGIARSMIAHLAHEAAYGK